jgi:hypothetical protein
VLFYTLLGFVLVVPVVHELRAVLHPAVPPVLEYLALVILLANAVNSVHFRPAATLGLGLPAAVLGLVHSLADVAPVAALHYVFAAAFFSYVVAVLMRFIFASPTVTANTVYASLCAYLLLGVVWAEAYALLSLFDPDAFYSSVPTERLPLMLRLGKGESAAALYYSYVTLTTLGYGDIVPTSPVARALASVEAISGQLYLVVLVSRLVGLYIADSLARSKGPPDPGPG